MPNAPDTSPIPIGLLDRYITGECTPAERTRVAAWIAADPARQLITSTFREVDELFDVSPDASGMYTLPVCEPNVDAIFARFEHSAGTAELRIPRIAPVFQRRRVPRIVTAGAIGAAVILVGLGVSWKTWLTSASKRTVASVAPARDVHTRHGERATLDLADGTRVILAPESRLRIPAAYTATAGARDIELDGEASFIVTHDAARPFRVHTAMGTAEDIGTEFDVTTYPETRGMRVVVASGAVAIRHDLSTPSAQPLAVLQHGDLAWLAPSGKVAVRRGIDPQLYFAWKSGRLVFDGMPLRDALAVLGRWYDVDLRLGDAALAARPLVATIDGETVRGMVERLSLALNARAEWHGKTVTLHAH